jgi:hypothetical protein
MEAEGSFLKKYLRSFHLFLILELPNSFDLKKGGMNQQEVNLTSPFDLKPQYFY